MAKSKKSTQKRVKGSKKTKTSAKKEGSAYFVEVKGKDVVRLSILESTKLVLKLMKEYENYKHIKTHKENTILRVMKGFREINRLVGLLKSKLPSVDIILPKQAPKAKVPKAKEKKPQETAKKETTELEKLESELAEIEKKLSSFG